MKNYTQYKNWHIYENLNAVQPYSFFRDDYNGEKMQGNKQGTAPTLAEAKQKIDEQEQSK